ncbi:MAG: PIN domain-containing protein [Patescibacteria group bacterium]|nr:PIN domain-containing protein [Patescibacteria group bacterium]MDE2589821.1 PIN domain-containing protein [Patescibacteria group bacterium]
MLVDTNILIYAINADSPKHKLSQTFLESENNLVIAHQNIFEALRVLTHPKFTHPMKPRSAQDALWTIIDSYKIIYPNNKTHYLALEYINEHSLVGNKIFDAYLAATAISNSITTIATDNTKDFKIFGIDIINPFVK